MEAGCTLCLLLPDSGSSQSSSMSLTIPRQAQTSPHKTHRCVILQQAEKKEEVAGEVLDNGFHFISGCRIHKKQSEITPALERHRADDLGAGSRNDNCVVVTLVLLLFQFLFVLLALFGGLSMTPVETEIPHGSCCLLLLHSP